MSNKISCPYCNHSMSIKPTKLGKFKPTCSKCQQSFVLEIRSLEPLEIHVESAKPSSATQPELAKEKTKADADERKGRESVEETMQETPTMAPPATASQPSAPPKATVPTKPSSAVEETVMQDKTVEQQSSLDPNATLDASDNEKTVEHSQTEASDLSSKPSPTRKPTAPRPPAVPKNDVRQATSPTMAGGPSSNSKRDFSIDATMDSAQSSAPASVSASATSNTAKQSGSQATVQRLGGYRVLQELGRGGMGSVYLAKQISLDRNVALKTIQTEWASNPRVIARFIREAYAAAQLTHHNVVQIYDLGEEAGTNFFSMELVGGGSLDDLLKKTGKLDPKTAASFIAQAARGLKFAHDNGMVHRDIKPANLMLTSDGLVKVADLGLVKTPHVQDDDDHSSSEDRNIMLASARSQVTGFGSTMGTPAYMSPEQAEDAANVDHRADIYSLGCTFYALLTGRPPFTSNSALEIITKHKTEPLIRPDKVVEGVPSELATIVERMTAKKPQDRYQDLGGVIVDLESFLGADSSKAFAPSVEHAERIKKANESFNAAGLVKLRGLVPLAFTVFTIVLAGVLWTFGFRSALTVLSLLFLTPVSVAALTGLLRSGSPIATRYRAMLFGSRLSDWVTWGIGGLLVLVVLAVLGMIPHAIVAVLLSLALGFAYHRIFHQSLHQQRSAAIDQAEGLLRELRIGGLPENSVQQFVAEFSGKNWEEFFETLFDYDTMRQTRNALIESGKGKGKQRFRTWRDALINRIDARLLQQKLDREQKVLSKVERASLKAAGMSDAEAKEKAEDMAATMVTVASEARQTMAEISFDASGQKAAAKRERIKAMLAEARSGQAKQGSSLARRATSSMFAHLFGSKLRFALGGLMIAGCALWAQQNNLLDPEKLKEIQKTTEQIASQATDAMKNKDIDGAKDIATDAQAKLTEIGSQLNRDTKPWSIMPIFDSFAPGIIGLLILMSSLVYGWRFSFFALIAAAVCMFGSSFGVPSLGPISASWTSGAIAFVVLVIGLFVGRMPAKKEA